MRSSHLLLTWWFRFRISLQLIVKTKWTIKFNQKFITTLTFLQNCLCPCHCGQNDEMPKPIFLIKISTKIMQTNNIQTHLIYHHKFLGNTPQTLTPCFASTLQTAVDMKKIFPCQFRSASAINMCKSLICAGHFLPRKIIFVSMPCNMIYILHN